MNRFLLSALCLVLATAFAVAQPNDNTKPAAKTAGNSKPAKDPEAERIARERRENAQGLLISLAADAGRFNDQTLRARTQARIADALWASDPDRARALFRKAWESAEIVDQEGIRKMQEEIRQQEARGGSVAVSGPPNIRGEVLRLAARKDRALGEELLAKLRTEKQQEAADLSSRARANAIEQTPEAIRQRLTLARQLLDGDVDRAVQFADPALATLSREAIDFLSYLREKDAAAADRRYAALLARAAGDLQSDANTVSFLSSYLFTPHIFVTFTANGSTSQSSRNSTPPPDVSPDLRAAFFRTAAEILLRPLAPPGQDQTSTGPQGKYLMMKRLAPLFDRYANKELADAIHAQIDALAQGLPEDARNRDDDTLREGIREPQSSDDREKFLRDRLDRAKTSEERDSIFIELARLYALNGDLKARDFVDKIDDTELRKQARSFFDASLISWAIDKKDPDRVLDLLRSAEITNFQKSWVLLQAARLVGKTDPDKTIGLIEEATTTAKRLEPADADRARVLMAVANAWLSTDRSKAWEAVYEAVKAANAAESFTGEDGAIRTTLRFRQSASIRSSSVAEFNVTGIFNELAKENYERTVELARGFEREAPRASATIAIARAVLEEKKN